MRRLSIEIDPTDPKQLQKVHINFTGYEGAQASVDLPFDEKTLPAILKVLEEAAYRPGYFTEEEQKWLCGQGLIIKEGNEYFLQSSRKRQEKIGKWLFDTLFNTEKMRSVLREVQDDTETADQWVQLELKFPATAKMVGALPWELLYDGTRFLCAEASHSVTRYLVFERAKPRRVTPQQLRILLIAPRPADNPDVALKGDVGAIETALQRLKENNIVELTRLEPPTLANLQDYLSDLEPEEMPHIIHFDSHGTFGRLCRTCNHVETSSGERRCSASKNGGQKCDALLPGIDEARGYLLFEDGQCGSEYVSAMEFATTLGGPMVSGADASLPPALSLVVLSACKSALAQQGESVFNGVAQRLIDARIPAVVAMQFRIDETEAAHFVGLLYKRIAKDPLALAVNKGIRYLGTERGQWYRPVLYLRWQDDEGGRLFKPQPVGPKPAEPVSKAEEEKILKAADDTAAYPGGPNDFVELTQEFLPVEGRRRILAIDQEAVIKDFAMMIVPSWREKMDGKHILVLQAGKGKGKSLALDRFEYICKHVKSRQQLIYCKIDFEGHPGLFPHAAALKILSGLRDNAEDDPNLKSFLQSKLIDPLDPSGGAQGLGRSELKTQSIDPDKLADHLYQGLDELSKEHTIILLLDSYHAIAAESGPWLISNFLTKVRDGRNNKIIVVLTSDIADGLESEKYGLRNWRDVDFPHTISRILPENVQQLARFRHPDVSVPTNDEAKGLLMDAADLSADEFPSMRSLISLLDWRANGARMARTGGQTDV